MDATMVEATMVDATTVYAAEWTDAAIVDSSEWMQQWWVLRLRLRLQLPGIKQIFGCWNQPRVKTLPLSHSVWQNLASSIGAATDGCWNQPYTRCEWLQQMIAGLSHCN